MGDEWDESLSGSDYAGEGNAICKPSVVTIGRTSMDSFGKGFKVDLDVDSVLGGCLPTCFRSNPPKTIDEGPWCLKN